MFPPGRLSPETMLLATGSRTFAKTIGIVRAMRRMRSPCCAPEPRDGLSAFDHSITSSARSKIDCGTARPSALAVLRFTTISNLVGN